MRVFFVSLMVAAILPALSSRGAMAETLAEQLGKSVPDSQVQEMLTLALKNIQKALCKDSKPCEPATPDELAHPPISIDQARGAIAQGAVTALVQFCGLDYRRNLLPTMAYYHNEFDSNDRALSLIELLHGISQSQQLASYRQSMKVCPDGLRDKLDSELPKL